MTPKPYETLTEFDLHMLRFGWTPYDLERAARDASAARISNGRKTVFLKSWSWRRFAAPLRKLAFHRFTTSMKEGAQPA